MISKIVYSRVVSSSTRGEETALMPKTKSSSLRFLQQFITNPGGIGAVSPSSRKLAHQMVDWIDWGEVEAVAEYGPGTGVFTERIVSEIRPETNFFGIENNPDFFDAMRQRYTDHSFYHDSVENIEAICKDQGIDQIDAVVSGLPWAVFEEDMQRKYMDSMMRVLRPGGQFVTFAYLSGLALPAGRRFKKQLHEQFTSVEYSEVVWLNLPPAFVYRCRR